MPCRAGPALLPRALTVPAIHDRAADLGLDLLLLLGQVLQSAVHPARSSARNSRPWRRSSARAAGTATAVRDQYGCQRSRIDNAYRRRRNFDITSVVFDGRDFTDAVFSDGSALIRPLRGCLLPLFHPGLPD